MVMFSRDGEIESNMIFLLFNFNSDISFGSSCMALNDMVDVFLVHKERKQKSVVNLHNSIAISECLG